MKALSPALHVSGMCSAKKGSVSFFSPQTGPLAGVMKRSSAAPLATGQLQATAAAPHQVGNLELQQLMAQKQCEQSAFNKCNSSFIQQASKSPPPLFYLFEGASSLKTCYQMDT